MRGSPKCRALRNMPGLLSSLFSIISPLKPSVLDEPFEDGHLDVETVLRLVEDGGSRPLDHLVRDLLPPVGGAARRHDRPAARLPQPRARRAPPAGHAPLRSTPGTWAASTHELATLFPSPMKATRIFRRSLPRSPAVIRSARTWHGWCPSVSPLITGTVAGAGSSTAVSGGTVRITTASAYRERTRAVSRTGSPRPICVSCGDRKSA